ncbi:BTB/POZ domain-containing protein 2-like [Bradysia coprophila]|uniref:BTB/POZ domain-containing protein 2-like n=1 Tax=Bradysia coprophila TaxID=38358 RepID=UPI00187DAA73|nr:BTB/POZ domain-containing protein 2-like [Bradysia coprophila]
MTTKFINPIPRKATTSMFLEGDLSDLKFAFVVENVTKILPAHQCILAQNSSVFRNMFNSSVPETEVTINIVDASYSEFEEFLQFFYREEVALTMTNIEGVVRLADKYDVTECLDICVTFLEGQLTFANLFLIYQLAETFNISRLTTLCEDKIQYSTLEMLKSSAFLDYTKEVLNSILLMDGLACTESHLFDACIEWAKNSCRKNELDESEAQNLRQQLGDSIYLIRFRAMIGEEIVQIMTNKFYAGLFSHKELVEVLCLRNVADFKCETFCPKTRAILSFQLNRSPVLICRGGECHVEIIRKESEVFFQSNVPALLNEIHFLAILELTSLKFSITLTENNVPKVLFHGSVTYGSFNSVGPKLSLTKVVLIKPNTVYRISIATDGFNGTLPNTVIGTADTSDLMKDVPLSFVNDPSMPPPTRKCSVSTSIVKALYLKQI